MNKITMATGLLPTTPPACLLMRRRLLLVVVAHSASCLLRVRVCPRAAHLLTPNYSGHSQTTASSHTHIIRPVQHRLISLPYKLHTHAQTSRQHKQPIQFIRFHLHPPCTLNNFTDASRNLLENVQPAINHARCITASPSRPIHGIVSQARTNKRHMYSLNWGAREKPEA